MVDRVNDIMGVLLDPFSKLSFIELVNPATFSNSMNPTASNSSRRSSFSDPSVLSARAKNLTVVPEPLHLSDRLISMELLKSWFDLIPICRPVGLQTKEILSLISRHIFSALDWIKDASANALVRLVKIGKNAPDCWTEQCIKQDFGFWVIENVFELGRKVQSEFTVLFFVNS
jgi:hypothetical protein